jgi:hypothetical protein
VPSGSHSWLLTSWTSNNKRGVDSCLGSSGEQWEEWAYGCKPAWKVQQRAEKIECFWLAILTIAIIIFIIIFLTW